MVGPDGVVDDGVLLRVIALVGTLSNGFGDAVSVSLIPVITSRLVGLRDRGLLMSCVDLAQGSLEVLSDHGVRVLEVGLLMSRVPV